MAAVIKSGFGHDLDGWTSDNEDYALKYKGSGGDPGGYLSLGDHSNHLGSIVAPSEFRGDLTGFADGNLTLDYKGNADPVVDVFFFNGHKEVEGTFFNPPQKPNEWSHFVFSMTDLRPMGNYDAETVLENVTSFKIDVRITSPEHGIGFDNIRLAAAKTSETFPQSGLFANAEVNGAHAHVQHGLLL